MKKRYFFSIIAIVVILLLVGCSSEIKDTNDYESSLPEDYSSLIEEASKRFGNQCIVLAVDAKKRGDNTGWNVYVEGGRKDTGIDCMEWILKGVSLGAGEILLTSMDADGTKDGFDLDLYRAVSKIVNVPVIASGGCGKLEDFKSALEVSDAALAASIFHYEESSVLNVKKYLKEEGVAVRL